MNDVARHAGLSQTTVSLVLNNPSESGIPAATQARVLAAVEAVGYRTNRLARAMRLNRTDTLGFLSDDIAATPYANRMIKGAQDAALAAGKLLLIVNTGAIDAEGHGAIEQGALNQLLERQVDGVIYGAMYHRTVTAPAALSEARRAVLLDCGGDDAFASVVPDEFDAAFRATQHLIDHGHRRIAHISIDHAGAAVQARRAGYKQALLDAAIVPEEQLLIIELATAAGGRRAMNAMHQLADPPTAVFCYNDQAAMGVYQQARELDIRIPDDLSIVGFDDQQLIAAELVPGLTTMRLPHYEMGTWAVEYLLDQSLPLVNHVIECPLIERGSVAQP